MNIFWDTITHYNAGTWIYQVIITLIGIILTCSLFKSPTKKIKVAMKLYLIFLNVWIASVYYMIYCEPRSYNSALAGFWGIMAIFWIYDLKVNYTSHPGNGQYTRQRRGTTGNTPAKDRGAKANRKSGGYSGKHRGAGSQT